MIACVDVSYSVEGARAACVVINSWQASSPCAEHVAHIKEVGDYQPGEFYRRELPCIQSVLAKLERLPTYVVVDGYVWLDERERPGLGAHLYEALECRVPIIGVAKNPFNDQNHATALKRGTSERPLYITAAGIPLPLATDFIRLMHGEHRMPTILKRVDQLSRKSSEL